MKKTLLASLLCVVVTSTQISSFAYQANQNNTTQAGPTLMGLNLWNESTDTITLIGNQNGQGYTHSYEMFAGQSTGGWWFPVGSTVCVLEEVSGDLDFLKVVGNPTYVNNLKLKGSFGHTWFDLDASPNLQFAGHIVENGGIPGAVNDCKNHK